MNYNQTIWRMSRLISERRDQLRQEIRKKERQSFFLQERMQMMKNYKHDSPIVKLIESLNNKVSLQEVLEEIGKIINGANYYEDVMQMMEQGLIPILMSFLRDDCYLKQTLEIISFLVQRMKPKKHVINIYERLYHSGILEYLMKNIGNKPLSSLCAFIICSFSDTHEDYCQALAVGNGYKLLMDQFIARANYSDNVETENETIGLKFYTYILNTLQNIIMMKDSALDLEACKLDIFSFIVSMMEKRMFLKHSFGIFYECLRNIGSSLGESYAPLINTLVSEAQPNCNYLHNLLASVYLMSPHSSIDYCLCCQQAIKYSKLYKLISLILQKLMGSNKSMALIPTDQIFWQKLFLNPKDQETQKRFLFIGSQLSLDKDLMWRVLGAELQSSSVSIQRDALSIIHTRVITPNKEQNMVFRLKKYQILQKLQVLSSSAKNQIIQQKASYLIDYILGPLAEMSERLQ